MIVDFHTYLGRWPVYPLRVKNAAELIQRMDRVGIGASFVSNIESVLTWDCHGANQYLARSVARFRKRLLPVGTINLALSGWASDVREGILQFDLAGFRLFPTYHGYQLDSPVVESMVNLLADKQLPVFIAAFIDEERFQPHALRALPVSIDSIIHLIRNAPDTMIVLNNLTPEQGLRLLQEPDLPLDNIFMDIGAMDKEFDGLGRVLNQCGSKHLVYGSQVPFLYPEAVLALIQENGFNEADVESVLERNWFDHPMLKRMVTCHTR